MQLYLALRIYISPSSQNKLAIGSWMMKSRSARKYLKPNYVSIMLYWKRRVPQVRWSRANLHTEERKLSLNRMVKTQFPLYRHISIQHTLFQFVLRMCEFQSGGRKAVWHLKWAHEESDNQWIQRLRIIHLSNWKRILFSETPGVFKRSNTIRSLGWVITDVVTF